MKIGKTVRRLAALLLVAVGAVCLLCASASADAGDGKGAAGEVEAVIRKPLKNDYHGKTVILHSNDVQGAVEGYARMAWLKGEFERQGAETILADAGDFSFGAIYNSTQGSAAVELMNLTGYSVATLGDYDFSYGYEALRQNLRRAAFPVLCANALEDGYPICIQNYSYTTQSGLTIGFFGILTPKTSATREVGESRNIKILRRRDIYRCVQEQIDTLRDTGSVIPGADIVIGLTHVGNDAEPTPTGYSSSDIYRKTTGLDLILDGHSQTVMTAGKHGEAVQSCGSDFAYIGVVVIDNETKTIEKHYLVATEGLEADPTVLQAAEMLQARYQAEYGAMFARSTVELNGESDPGVRTEETNLGDLIADAMIWAAQRAWPGPDIDAARIVGITNGGGIRASISEGSVTRSRISAVFPFANTVSVVYVTGAELLEVLEASTWCLPEYSNSYPQSSGIAFTLDERIPYDAGSLYPDSRFYSPASIQRVTITHIRGQPFDPEETYAVVTNNYCAAGNGTYYLFGTAEKQFDTGVFVEQAIVNYIRQGLGGLITEAMYGQPRGDHTLLT